MTIQATIRVNKAQAKDNITYSISKDKATGAFRSVNITGSLVACEGFVTSDKVNLDQEVLASTAGTTLLIYDNKVGANIAKTAKHIYAERAAVGDLNPTIEINFSAETFSITETNILAKGISNVSVNANATLVDSSEQALANLQKANSNSKVALSAAKSAASGVARFAKQLF